MSRNIIVALLVGIMMAGLIPSVSAQDDPKINFRVLSNKAIHNEFSGNITTHIYAISASQGDLVTVSMTQEEGSALDPYLVLLGPRGNLIAADDDSGELSLSSLITDAEIPADGLYFVVASSFEFVDDIMALEIPEGENWSYTISASGFTEPSAEVATQFATGQLTANEPLSGISSAEEPVYYFTFIGEEGQIVDITLASEDFDTLLYLMTPDGDRIAINDDDPDNVGTNSAIRGVELPISGKYLIFATDVFFYDTEIFTGGEFEIGLTVE